MSGLLSVQFGVYEPISPVQKAIIPTAESFTATAIRNRAAEGALTMEVAKGVAGVEWLLKPCEFALQARLDDGTYQELDNMRFLNMIDAQDLAAPQGSTVTANCLPIGWLFDTALVYPLSGQPASKRPFRKFKSKTVGEIWNTLLFEAQSRGNLKGIKKNWTNSADSRGKSWGASHTEVFNVGDTLLDVLNYMCEHGMCNVRFRGRLFELLKPGTLDNPGNKDILRIGQDILSMPRRRDHTTVRTHALGIGNEAVYASSVTNSSFATSESPWGRWDVAINVNGDTFSEVSEATKRKLYNQWGEFAIDQPVDLSLNPKGPQPFFDYALGDYVGIATGSGQVDPSTRYRVDAVTLSRDSGTGALGASINLGKRHKRALAKTASRLRDLERETRGAVQLASQYASAAGSPPSPVGELKFKLADTVRSNTTLVDDPHLQFEVASDATYRFEGLFVPDASANDLDIRYQWSFPSGSQGSWSVLAPSTSVNSIDGTVKWLGIPIASSAGVGVVPWEFGLGSGAVNKTPVPGGDWVRGAIQTSGTAGNFRLQWGKDLNNLGNIALITSTWMHLWRVA